MNSIIKTTANKNCHRSYFNTKPRFLIQSHFQFVPINLLPVLYAVKGRRTSIFLRNTTYTQTKVIPLSRHVWAIRSVWQCVYVLILLCLGCFWVSAFGQWVCRPSQWQHAACDDDQLPKPQPTNSTCSFF